jgi:archaellum biogenesis ATPase FlaH
MVNKCEIPGATQLIGRDNLEILVNANFVLIGQQGSGKTMYCRQFLSDGLRAGAHCIYLNSSINERECKSLFRDINKSSRDNFHFINPYLQKVTQASKEFDTSSSIKDPKLNKTLNEIEILLKGLRGDTANENNQLDQELDKTEQPQFCFVLDSLTHLSTIFNEEDVLKFINGLVFMLKEVDASSVFTATGTSAADDRIVSRLSSLFDGILELKKEELNEIVGRKVRLVSLRGFVPKSSWITFEIDHNGGLKFVTSEGKKHEICGLCKAPILNGTEYYSEMAFHPKHLEIYKKLAGAYGQSRISDVGPSGVIDAHFFFVDIVGLSDPSLSVRKQIEKIEALNLLIGSCSVFKTASDKKVLPTGDGMVIAFMLNPELPLKLGIELHNELHKYNQNMNKGELSRLGVRIGLASGPVFIVNDINNNQNIWGPGIIFARRVMDLGDSGHILMAGGMAEALLGLDERNEKIIKFLGNYQAKHGQMMKMYSAYSDSFGNREIPKKLIT